MDLDRYADDAPDDDAPDGGSVCVVAVQLDTYERCREGFSPAPRSYGRTRREFDYMALYRTAPVTDRVEQRRGGDGPMNEGDWADLIEIFSDEEAVLVSGFGDPAPLDAPVENDDDGVRGAWYCTIGDLRESGTLSAPEERADT